MMGAKRLARAITLAVVIVFVSMAAISAYIYNDTENLPPTCSLIPNHSSGKAPLIVVFYLSASDLDGGIASWYIDVNGDGTPNDEGTGDPPSTFRYNYTEQGLYDASFMVTDDKGSEAISNVTIAILPMNVAPTCNLTCDRVIGTFPLNVTLMMTANDSDGSIESWSLKIGLEGELVDQYFGLGPPPANFTYVFNETGLYDLLLTVKDDDGAEGSSNSLSINVLSKPPDTLEVNVIDLGQGDTSQSNHCSQFYDKDRISIPKYGN